MVKVVAVQDDSSHWYVIPNELKNEFYRLQENIESDYEEFDKMFSHYRTNGDLNNIQLYAEL